MTDKPDVMTSQLPCPICLVQMEKGREMCVKCHLALKDQILAPMVLHLLKRIEKLESELDEVKGYLVL